MLGINNNDSESLHEAAMRLTGMRGCSGGCTCKKCAGVPCDANDVRCSNETNVCLIRRIAQCENADEQIEWLKEWQKFNPPKPHWEVNKPYAVCSSCGHSFFIDFYIFDEKLSRSKPSWKFCPNCGKEMEY